MRHQARKNLSRFGCVLRRVFHLANVKAEPRPWLARRVPKYDSRSVASFRKSFDSTRRDSHGRWLWRLVRPVFSPLELHPGLVIWIETDGILLRARWPDEWWYG